MKPDGEWTPAVPGGSDPRELVVGDVVVFEAFPDEWSRPAYRVPRRSREWMSWLVRHRVPCIVESQLPDGFPELRGIWRFLGGRRLGWRRQVDWWIITESTGWRRLGHTDDLRALPSQLLRSAGG